MPRNETELTVCTEDKSAKYLNTGEYGLVSRIDGNVFCAEERSIKVATFSPRAIWKRIIGGEALNVSEINTATAINRFQHKVFAHAQIGGPETARLEQDLAPNTIDSKLIGAQYYGMLVYFYLDAWGRTMRNKKLEDPAPSYFLGLVLADMLEVLPVKTSAKLLLASGDPEIARITITSPRRGSDIERIDPQPYTVEGIALTTSEARREIFEEMARISPGRNGGARRLLGLIALEWSNRHSLFCGQSAIHHNLDQLEDETAMEKILEVQGELPDLGRMIDNIK